MRLLLLVATFAAAFAANAHVVLDRKSADASSFYKATFMVGHGCHGGLATTEVRVRIPESIVQVKPQPKHGWTMEMRRETLARPYEYYGRTITDRVAEVVWRGSLAFDHYDEFVMLLRLPAAAGKLHFPVRQGCGSDAAMDWSEIPAAGKTRRDYKFPAAELDVLEPAKAAEPAHRH